ncbi:hypothetical protein ACMHYB_44625 [Sorangium sp. So ce1128]
MSRFKTEDYEVELFADTDGRLGFVVHHKGSIPQIHIFQRILISRPGHSQLLFAWSAESAQAESAQMYFGGIELAPDPLGDAPVAFIDMADSPDVVQAKRLYTNVLANDSADESERFLLDTLQDIETKLSLNSRYHLIRAAGLLRQLLLDGAPLVHRVNRKHRLRLRFRIMDLEDGPPVAPVAYWRSLDPSSFPNGKTIETDLEGLLRARVLDYQETHVTARNVIKACANAKGGVHFGEAADDAEQTAIDFDGVMIAVGSEPSLIAIDGLCRVVLAGLQPLVATFARMT